MTYCLFYVKCENEGTVPSSHIYQLFTDQNCSYYSCLHYEFDKIVFSTENLPVYIKCVQKSVLLLLSVCFRWPVLCECQVQACFVLVLRLALPHVKPPCDLLLHGATGRSSPCCRTCDRRCGWPAPDGWLKEAKQWPWGGERQMSLTYMLDKKPQFKIKNNKLSINSVRLHLV